MRLGMWNVMSLYRAGSLKTLARKTGKYKLDEVGIQEVRWDGTRVALNRQMIIHFFLQRRE
jgi:hypothetical protein